MGQHADAPPILDFDAEAYLAALTELLAIPSTAERPEELRRAVDFVVDFASGSLPPPQLRVERFESRGKPSALLYYAPPSAARPDFRVVLNGHLDVVPADPAQFVPRRLGDRLYARGAQDMKATALALATVFRDVGPALPYPVALQLVADEEVGGRDGTLHQLESGVRGSFAILGEHSRLDLVADAKGLVHAVLDARGRSAHGAYPWLGDNALIKIMTSVTRLTAAYPTPAEAAWCTTVNLARIETPNQAVNQVPDAARAWLDIRFPAEDAALTGRSAEQVAEYLQGFCEPGVTVSVESLAPPHHVDRQHPDIVALRRAVRGVGYPAAFLTKHGSCDARFYSVRGVPAVVFGIGGDGQHSADEYADLTTVEPYCRALAAFLVNLEG